MAHGLWTSTELGNIRLDKAFKSATKIGGKLFLFFLVNKSGKFCGIAEMTNSVEFDTKLDIWTGGVNWKGVFPIRWIITSDLPFSYVQLLKNPENNYKPIFFLSGYTRSPTIHR